MKLYISVKQEGTHECYCCGREIKCEREAVYNGVRLCDKCYKYALSDAAIIGYAAAYPRELIKFMAEMRETECFEVFGHMFREWSGEKFKNWVVGD